MLEPIDAYCERTSAVYWAEPVNAVTNAAFLIAAVIMWRRTEGLPKNYRSWERNYFNSRISRRKYQGETQKPNQAF